LFFVEALIHMIFARARPQQLVSLENQATLARLAASLALSGLQESSTSGSLEDFADTLVGAGRALEVLVGANLLADFLTLQFYINFLYIHHGDGKAYLVLRNGALGGLGKLINSLAVIAKILLTADEDNRETLAEVQNLRNPLS
jgi:hypothetical protein